jgi:hypothetical protein
MIEALPSDDDERRAEDEQLAQQVSAVIYAGEPFFPCQFRDS